MIRNLIFLFFLLTTSAVNAFMPTIAFWQRSGSQVFATIDSLGLGPTPSNSLAQRSVDIAGPGILSYKAVVITSGDCTSAGVNNDLLTATETSIIFPFSFTPIAPTVDTFFTVCAIGKNFTGSWQSELLPTASATLRVNTIIPVIQNLALNNGVTNTVYNVVPSHLSATHVNLNITHFCFKSLVSTLTPTAPTTTDPCWKALDGTSPNVFPSPSVSFSNFIFNIGYGQETYNVFAWAKSEAGAISELNGANGSLGVDKFTIDYSPASAPSILNVIATNTDSPSSPISTSDLVVPSGSSVYIKWKATDDAAIPANAISISYTVDETNFTSVISGLPNSQGSGCSIDANHTGCYKWVNGSPFSTYFKIRAGVTDSTGLLSYASAPPNNTSPFSIIAGNTDLGLNGSATSAILKTVNSSSTDAGEGRFVVRADGNVFILDERGLLTIDPLDGLLKLLIPITGTITEGNLSTATLIAPVKMALDINDNLIIYDYNRIRKINFTTSQISTIVGGGASNADGTAALNFNISPIGVANPSMIFTVLPNGNIWFQSAEDYNRSPNDGAKLRIYNSTDHKVYSLIPSGIGSLEDINFDPSSYRLVNFGIAFNPITSEVTKIRSRSSIPTIGGHNPRSVSYDPITGGAQAPHVPFVSYWPDDNTFTSMSGTMYSVDHFFDNGIFRYNSGTNSWTRILGTGVKGQCNDGTDALSCNTDPNDVYVSSTGQVYFVDRNRIRIIDSNNKIQTIFGQSLSYGDGGLATSARLNYINWIDRANDGRIILADNNEFRMREFQIGGTMSLIAGTGTDANPDTTNPASTQPVSVKYWGGTYPFVVDPTNGDIFYNRNGNLLTRLDRASDRWIDFAGYGGTPYTTADGLLGSQIGIGGYAMGPQGYNGTQVLRALHEWNGTQPFNSQLKLYSTTDGQQTHFAGLTGTNVDSLDNCSAGSTLANCKVPENHNILTKAQWDSGNGRWLIAHFGSSKIHTAVTGGLIGDLVNLPRGINSFYYLLKSSVPTVYYCSGGRVFKYNLNTSTETALFWPTSTISCMGFSMTWDPTRNSIIFPISQNGIGGIAEIIDP